MCMCLGLCLNRHVVGVLGSMVNVYVLSLQVK